MLTVDFERMRLDPRSVVLDLGCGDGRHTRAARLLPGVDVVALDIGSQEAATTARSVAEMDDPDAAFPAAPEAGDWMVVRGDSYALPFADRSLDCVIASEVLEHLHDDDTALDEIYRVLKPGGEVAVSVPRFGPEALCWALSRDYRHSDGGHVRIYRRSALARKLAAHGFELYAAHFAHALHAPYWWLKCALGLEKTGGVIGLYQRFLVWDMFAKPPLTRFLERLLNPVIGKSEVFYGRKPGLATQMEPVRRQADLTPPLAAAASMSSGITVEAGNRSHGEVQGPIAPTTQTHGAEVGHSPTFKAG